jgi:hypothetical protein
MNTYKRLILVMAMVAIGITKGYGQQSGGDQKQHRKEQVTQFSKSLGIDSVKAGKVADIQSSYKKSMLELSQQTNLKEEDRRAAIRSLMEDKNRTTLQK